MPGGWRTCKRCGWWQKSTGPCSGCTFSSRSAKATPSTARPSNQPPLTDEVLRRRWSEAQTSASNPHHVKIERMCTHCLLRTINSKPTCRGCLRSLGDCARILPGQWPPLGCPSSLLKKFGEMAPAQEDANDKPQSAPPQADKTEGMDFEGSSTTERPLIQVPLAQLKTEISRLEKHLLDMPAEGFQALRDITESSLMTAKRELQARKPEGASLDKAIARQRQTAKAKLLAEEQVQDCRAALERAEKALAQANEADQLANQDVQKMRALIAEAEPPADIRSVPTPAVDQSTLQTLCRFLQQAGLTPEQLTKVGDMFGQNVPCVPPPPLPMGTNNPPQSLASQLLTPAGEPLKHPSAVATGPLPCAKAQTSGARRRSRLCLHLPRRITRCFAHTRPWWPIQQVSQPHIWSQCRPAGGFSYRSHGLPATESCGGCPTAVPGVGGTVALGLGWCEEKRDTGTPSCKCLFFPVSFCLPPPPSQVLCLKILWTRFRMSGCILAPPSLVSLHSCTYLVQSKSRVIACQRHVTHLTQQRQSDAAAFPPLQIQLLF